jgi:hypothetical protein
MCDTEIHQELDVRPLRKPDKHPTIFATYATKHYTWHQQPYEQRPINPARTCPTLGFNQ